MENYKDALESSTEVCTGDSGEDSTRDLLGIQWGSGRDLVGCLDTAISSSARARIMEI